MTRQFFLDPDRVSEIEPSEGDEFRRAWLSAYALPRNVTVCSDLASGFRIKIEYLGSEKGGPPTRLDEANDPAIFVVLAVHTQKVLEIAFAPAISASLLPHVARRLMGAADRCKFPAQRLSYRMTAKVIEEWIQPAFGETDSTDWSD